MAFTISVKTETERAEKYLRKAAKKQLPFATAVALTKTAKHWAEVERRSLSKYLDRITSIKAVQSPLRFAVAISNE